MGLNEDKNPFRYNGQYTDDETGLIYLRKRYYDPEIGRFISEDPAKDGLNWYVYCSGNPIMFVDPSGLFGKNTVLTNSQVYNYKVAKAQNELIYLGYMHPIPENEMGYFGPKTESAVRSFQRDRGLDVDGKIGKQTWTALGLKIDNDYEFKFYSGTPHAYSMGTYALIDGPQVINGISLGSVEAGIGKIGGEYEFYECVFEWEVDAVSAEAAAGITKEYQGVILEGSLIKAGCGLNIPLPFTEKSLYVGGEGNLFSVGYHSYYDRVTGKIKFGASALVGVGVVVGIVD